MDWQERLADEHETHKENFGYMVGEIMSEPEFNPYNPRNVIEAVMEDALFQGDDQFRFAELLEKREIHNLGLFVFGRIIAYWEKQAEKEAVKRLGEGN